MSSFRNGFSVRRLRIKCFLFTTQYLSFSGESVSPPTYCSEKWEKKAPEVFRNLFSTVKSNRKSIQRRTKGTSSSRNDGARDYLRPHNYPFFPTYSGARLPSPIQWYVALGNDKLILVGWSGGRRRRCARLGYHTQILYSPTSTGEARDTETQWHCPRRRRHRRCRCSFIGGDLCGRPLISRFCAQHNKAFCMAVLAHKFHP